MIEIVFAYLHPLVAREAPVGAFEHRRRKIDSKSRRLREANQNEGQQSAIAAAEIENPRRTLRDTVEQNAFTLGTVRNFVGQREITGCVALFGPLVHVGHALLVRLDE